MNSQASDGRCGSERSPSISPSVSSTAAPAHFWRTLPRESAVKVAAYKAAAQTQTPDLFGDRALWCWALAMTYFLTGNPQYHRRDVVSRSCSGWEGVGPTRYGRQEFWDSKVELSCALHRVIGFPLLRE